MSSPGRTLEDLLLFSSDLGDQGAEPRQSLGEGEEEEEEEESNDAADAVPPTASMQEPIMCSGCGLQVCERFFLLAAGGAWHCGCLRCSQCRCELQTHASLFCRDGNIYCHHDYSRIFGGGRCAGCFQPIPASTLVMKSGHMTFHLQCFCCEECKAALEPGSLYFVLGQSLYCQSHCQGGGVSPEVPPITHNPQLQTHLKDPGTRHNNPTAATPLSAEGEESVSSPEARLDDRVPGGRSHRRTKRIRTCFRSEQLRALESYFAHKHNPDGKDWTGLVHRTGLPKRVLQVWFQNARAKLRRSLTSDDPQVNAGMTPSLPSLSPPPSCSQSQPFSASTIDQLQLSLITAPLHEPPLVPPEQLQSPALFLDYSPAPLEPCEEAESGSPYC